METTGNLSPESAIQSAIEQGRLARAAQRHEDAYRYYEIARQLAPPTSGIALECAHELGTLGRHGEAEILYLDLLKLFPGNPRVHRGLGLAAATRGDIDAAAVHYRTAIALTPAVDWIALEYLDHLLRSGRFDAAAALCASYQQKSPASPLPWIGSARLARDRGDPQAMRAALHAALARDPQSFTALTMLAAEEHANGNPAVALDLCARILRLEPANVSAHLIAAAIHREAERYAEAGQVLEQGLARAAHAVELTLELVRVKRAMGQPELARHILTAKITELFPNPAIEQILEGLGPADAAATEARPPLAIAGHPVSHAALLVELAELETTAGNHRRAFDVVSVALALRPDDLAASLLRSQLLVNGGKSEDAIRLLAANRQTFGNHPAFYARLGNFYQQAGMFPQTLELLAEGRRRFPQNFNVLSQWVSCAIRCGLLAEVHGVLDLCRPQTSRQAGVHAMLVSYLLKAEGRSDEVFRIQDYLASAPEAEAHVSNEAARSAIPRLDPRAARRLLADYAEKASRDPAPPHRKIIPSHSLIGQIATEFMLDPQALAAARAARTRPPGERIAALLQVVADFPDTTSSAMALFLELRGLGWLDPASGDSSNKRSGDTSRIPRNIFQYWDSEDVPGDIAAYCHTWQHLNPAYGYRLFNRKTAAGYLDQHAEASTRAAFRRVRSAAGKADIFRLAVLAHEGGIYCDADDRCLTSLDRMFDTGADLISNQEDIGSIGNNFLAAAPNHPVIQHALREATANIASGANDSIWLSTGPGQLSRSLAVTMAAHSAEWQNWLRRVRLFWWTEVSSFSAPHCFAAYKNTAAHWSSPATSESRHTASRPASA